MAAPHATVVPGERIGAEQPSPAALGAGVGILTCCVVFLVTICQAAVFGPLLGISIDAAPLCPDQDLSADLEQFILVMCILALILPAVQAVLMIVPTMCINSPATMDRASRFGQLVGVGFALTNFGWCLHGAINVIYGPGAINSCKEPSLSYATVLMWINLITMPLNACRNCATCLQKREPQA